MCTALRCASANRVCLGIVLSCDALVCVARLCSVVCLCWLWHAALLCCINKEWRPRPHSSTGAKSPKSPPKTLMPPHTRGRGGVQASRPTTENCTQISSVRLCRLYMLGRCVVLYCFGVCSAALFRCASLSPLACRDALVCYVVCYAASTTNGSHGYTGHGHALSWGPSPGILRTT